MLVSLANLCPGATPLAAATMELPVYVRDRNAVPEKVLKFRPEGAAWTVADVDGDGRSDLIYFGASWGVPNQINPPAPILVYHNLGNGKFRLVEADQLIEGSVPKVNVARRILAADFNGDGRLDVIVANHGHDFFPSPGEKNLLFLSRGSHSGSGLYFCCPSIRLIVE